MAQAQGITEELKATDQMLLGGRINNTRACADGIVRNELIYDPKTSVQGIKTTSPTEKICRACLFIWLDHKNKFTDNQTNLFCCINEPMQHSRDLGAGCVRRRVKATVILAINHTSADE